MFPWIPLTQIYMTVYTWLGVGGHISVSMDTIKQIYMTVYCPGNIQVNGHGVNGIHGNTNMTVYTKAGQ